MELGCTYWSHPQMPRIEPVHMYICRVFLGAQCPISLQEIDCAFRSYVNPGSVHVSSMQSSNQILEVGEVELAMCNPMPHTHPCFDSTQACYLICRRQFSFAVPVSQDINRITAV